MSYALWTALEQLRSDKYEWVELSHSLNNDSPFWSGIPAGSVELAKTCFDWGNPMLECLIQTFKFPGQFGTHIDFPGHFVKDAPLSEAYGTESMLFPLCVIDIQGMGRQVRRHSRGRLRGPAHGLVQALAFHGEDVQRRCGRQ